MSDARVQNFEVVGPKWLFLGFLGLAFGVFAATLCRTVPGGDSGELITMAYRLGVPHPPGYPLFTMLGHLATYLPFGEVAARVNFLSAIYAVVNGGILFKTVERWLSHRWLAALASGIFIFSPLAWRYSVATEVFTLNNLFISMLLYVTLRFIESPGVKWACAWAATLGLASSHHHTIIFLAIPVFAVLMWRYFRLLLSSGVLFRCIVLFILGFLPYLYLPWASQKMLISSWGESHTWSGFWTHFLRLEYGTFQLATSGTSSATNTMSNLRYYSADLWLQFLYPMTVLVFYSVWLSLRGMAKDYFLKVIFLSWVIYTIVFHALANMDLSNRLFYDVQSRFWLLPNTLLSLMLAYGLKQIAITYPQYLSPRRLIVFVVLVISLQIGFHYRMEDHSKNRIFFDLGRHLIERLPPKSLVLLRGDVYVNAVRYQQDVLGFRTDVRSIPIDLLWWPWMKPVVEKNFPELKLPGNVYRYVKSDPGDFTLEDFLLANWDQAEIYISKISSLETASVGSDFRLEPVGYLNRVRKKSEPFSSAAWFEEVSRFRSFRAPSKDEIRDKSWEAFVYYNFWDREIEKAKFSFESGMKDPEGIQILKEGVRILERVLRDYPEVPPQVLRNLGVAYQFLAKRDAKYAIFMLEAWRKYLALSPLDDPELPRIREIVERLQKAQAPNRPKK